MMREEIIERDIDRLGSEHLPPRHKEHEAVFR
jgi:hypothetical protein